MGLVERPREEMAPPILAQGGPLEAPGVHGLHGAVLPVQDLLAGHGGRVALGEHRDDNVHHELLPGLHLGDHLGKSMSKRKRKTLVTISLGTVCLLLVSCSQLQA